MDLRGLAVKLCCQFLFAESPQIRHELHSELLLQNAAKLAAKPPSKAQSESDLKKTESTERNF